MALRLGSSKKLCVFTNRVVFLLLPKLMQHGCLLQKPQNCAYLTRQVSHFANHTTLVSHFANKPIEYRNVPTIPLEWSLCLLSRVSLSANSTRKDSAYCPPEVQCLAFACLKLNVSHSANLTFNASHPANLHVPSSALFLRFFEPSHSG